MVYYFYFYKFIKLPTKIPNFEESNQIHKLQKNLKFLNKKTMDSLHTCRDGSSYWCG